MLCFALFPTLTRGTPLFFIVHGDLKMRRIDSGMTHRNEWSFLAGKNENVECVYVNCCL